MITSTKHRHYMPLLAALYSLGNFNVAYASGGDSTDGDWEFFLSPMFLWAQGIEGSSGIGPATAPLDITFKDALSNLEATFTIHFEMKRDKLTLFTEYQYVNLAPEAEAPNGVTLDVGFKDTIGELGVRYWLFATEKTDWEILGGARYTEQKLDVSIQDGPHLLDVDDDWWVGFIGVLMSATLSEKWTFVGRADYGLGSAGETNRILNLSALFDYRFRHWGSMFAGYKYMSYDYDNGHTGFDRYTYDATQQGPLLGLAFHW
jgi:hypothetical protein